MGESVEVQCRLQEDCMNFENSPETVLRLAQSFMECRIFHTAAELNIFTLLERTPMSTAEIADRIRGDERALSAVLDALAAMGFLVKKGAVYQCEGSAAGMLSENSPNTILPMVLHMASLWKRWSRLTDIARGIKESKEEFDFSRDAAELRAFIGAMHSIGEPLARRIVADLDAGGARSLLDVGGGSGTYTIAFLRSVPGMKATLFDLPEVIEMARERLTKAGLIDRATLVPGSFYLQELPAGHDLALLSAIIHSNSLEENLDLYKKIFRALNPGGRILVRDHVMNPDRTYPRDGAVFAINMLVGTSGGGTYTYEEIEQGLSQAGFTRIRLVRQGEHMDAVVEGVKP
jgi:predicted O-methyltransferase YrrM